MFFLIHFTINAVHTIVLHMDSWLGMCIYIGIYTLIVKKIV